MQTILEAAGSSLEEVAKVNSYVADPTRSSRFNEVYEEFFSIDPPSRATVGADLLGILIDCIARIREQR